MKPFCFITMGTEVWSALMGCWSHDFSYQEARNLFNDFTNADITEKQWEAVKTIAEEQYRAQLG